MPVHLILGVYSGHWSRNSRFSTVRFGSISTNTLNWILWLLWHCCGLQLSTTIIIKCTLLMDFRLRCQIKSNQLLWTYENVRREMLRLLLVYWLLLCVWCSNTETKHEKRVMKWKTFWCSNCIWSRIVCWILCNKIIDSTYSFYIVVIGSAHKSMRIYVHCVYYCKFYRRINLQKCLEKSKNEKFAHTKYFPTQYFVD